MLDSENDALEDRAKRDVYSYPLSGKAVQSC